MLTKFGSLSLLCALLVSSTWADVDIVVDDFESYADTTAFQAAWEETIGNGTAAAILADHHSAVLTNDATIFPGIQGKAADHIGATSSSPGMVNQWGGIIDQTLGMNPAFTINPSQTQSIVLKADMFISNVGNERMTIGLRSVTVSPDGPDPDALSDISTVNLLEMGQYNTNPAAPIPSGAPMVSTQFAYRLTLFGAVTSPVTDQPSWQYFTLAPELDRTEDADVITGLGDIGAGWHTYMATITPTSITLTLDLFRDGKTNLTRGQNGDIEVGVGADGVDASITYEIATLAAGFNSLRIGGPSGSASAGFGANAFDNISLRLMDIVPPGTPGDFNNDGAVDAADYAVWRDNVGTSNALPNDPIGGTIGTAQYNQWRANFGQTAGNGAGVDVNAPVPEPTSFLMMALAAGWWLRRGRAG